VRENGSRVMRSFVSFHTLLIEGKIVRKNVDQWNWVGSFPYLYVGIKDLGESVNL
jgi:hypothetical protein